MYIQSSPKVLGALLTLANPGIDEAGSRTSLAAFDCVVEFLHSG